MLFTLIFGSCLMSEEALTMIIRSMIVLFLGDTTLPQQLYDGQNLTVGQFTLESSHNFDSYLEELGVSFLLRRLASLAVPTVTISRFCPEVPSPVNSPDCLWKILTDTPFKSHSIQFQLNTKVPDLTMDGREIYSVFRMLNSSTMEEVQHGESANTTILRHFDDNAMTVLLSVNSVRANSTFIRNKSSKLKKNGDEDDFEVF